MSLKRASDRELMMVKSTSPNAGTCPVHQWKIMFEQPIKSGNRLEFGKPPAVEFCHFDLRNI